MKTRCFFSRRLALIGIAAIGLSATSGRLSAQAFFVSNTGNNTVTRYDANTGAPIGGLFGPSGLNVPVGISVAANILYVGNQNNATVTAYNAATGAAAPGFTTISAGMTGGFGPFNVLASGGLLYVSVPINNAVTAYNATTGAAATGFTTITDVVNPTALATLGTTLYAVTSPLVGSNRVFTIRTYNAVTGTLLNPNFATGFAGIGFMTTAGNTLYVSDQNSNTVRALDAVTGLAMPGFATLTDVSSPEGVQVVGNNLFVVDLGITNVNTVREYNATTGALINPNFITANLSSARGLAFSLTVPEPSTWALLGLGGAACLGLRRHRVRMA